MEHFTANYADDGITQMTRQAFWVVFTPDVPDSTEEPDPRKTFSAMIDDLKVDSFTRSSGEKKKGQRRQPRIYVIPSSAKSAVKVLCIAIHQ